MPSADLAVKKIGRWIWCPDVIGGFGAESCRQNCQIVQQADVGARFK